VGETTFNANGFAKKNPQLFSDPIIIYFFRNINLAACLCWLELYLARYLEG